MKACSDAAAVFLAETAPTLSHWKMEEGRDAASERVWQAEGTAEHKHQAHWALALQEAWSLKTSKQGSAAAEATAPRTAIAKKERILFLFKIFIIKNLFNIQ
jgi:hypothetical protein